MLQVADVILDSLAGVIRGHSWGGCPCRLGRSVWAPQQKKSGTIQSKCWGPGSFGEGNTHPCSLEKRQAVVEAGLWARWGVALSGRTEMRDL